MEIYQIDYDEVGEIHVKEEGFLPFFQVLNSTTYEPIIYNQEFNKFLKTEWY